MDYVSDVLSVNGGAVKILSVARPINTKKLFISSEDISISENVSVHFFNSFKSDSYLFRKFSSLWLIMCLFFYVLSHIKCNDRVIVYHSLAYVAPFVILKKLLRFSLILEVEEVYSNVSSVSPLMAKMENFLISLADAYIFPTELLDENVNNENKPSIIIYGNYNVPPLLSEKKADGIVHLIYSGTFNQRKGGAFSAISAGEFLSSSYHIHITGIGTDKQVSEVKKLIETINNKSECTISYDGFIKNEDYISYLQQFHIGLCTQVPDDMLSSFCFPSKILQYMSNGLNVLSSPAPAVKASKVAPFLSIYKSQDPKEIANCIMDMKINSDTRHFVKELDEKCRKEMASFLCSF